MQHSLIFTSNFLFAIQKIQPSRNSLPRCFPDRRAPEARATRPAGPWPPQASGKGLGPCSPRRRGSRPPGTRTPLELGPQTRALRLEEDTERPTEGQSGRRIDRDRNTIRCSHTLNPCSARLALFPIGSSGCSLRPCISARGGPFGREGRGLNQGHVVDQPFLSVCIMRALRRLVCPSLSCCQSLTLALWLCLPLVVGRRV